MKRIFGAWAAVATTTLSPCFAPMLPEWTATIASLLDPERRAHSRSIERRQRQEVPVPGPGDSARTDPGRREVRSESFGDDQDPIGTFREGRLDPADQSGDATAPRCTALHGGRTHEVLEPEHGWHAIPCRSNVGEHGAAQVGDDTEHHVGVPLSECRRKAGCEPCDLEESSLSGVRNSWHVVSVPLDRHAVAHFATTSGPSLPGGVVRVAGDDIDRPTVVCEMLGKAGRIRGVAGRLRSVVDGEDCEVGGRTIAMHAAFPHIAWSRTAWTSGR